MYLNDLLLIFKTLIYHSYAYTFLTFHSITYSKHSSEQNVFNINKMTSARENNMVFQVYWTFRSHFFIDHHQHFIMVLKEQIPNINKSKELKIS